MDFLPIYSNTYFESCCEMYLKQKHYKQKPVAEQCSLFFSPKKQFSNLFIYFPLFFVPI